MPLNPATVTTSAQAEQPARNLRQRFLGLLMGTAIGDSLGLPAEGLSRSQIRNRWQGAWRQRFVFGRGMCSDDTEHAFFVAQALLEYADDSAAFQKCLAKKLRFWLLGLPAGVGFATLRATLKLWLGFSPVRSGVFSAGNGPAMRSAMLGAYFFDDAAKRRQYVSASTQLTHADPKAEVAALAIAEAAGLIVREAEPMQIIKTLATLGSDHEWRDIFTKLQESFGSGKSVNEFALRMGLPERVTGYAYHTVPVALYAWLRSPDNFQEAIEAALNCGGDTDTVGAIVGALAGVKGSADNVPSDWKCIWEWPWSVQVFEEVARRLEEQKVSGVRRGPVRYFWPGLIPRNLIFLAVVLIHGFRRLIPTPSTK
jgi:ADP-ribosyl-[dinitrogen reductase] hydrolase